MGLDLTPQETGLVDQGPSTRVFGRYLTRLRTAFKFRRSNKVRKISASDNSWTKHVDTPEPCLSTPCPQLQANESTYRRADSSPASRLYITQGPSVPEQLRNGRFDTSTAVPSRTHSNPLPVAQDHRVKRATELFERYGIELDPDVCPYGAQTATTATIERVEKPIRMRVHHHCHHCCLAISPTGICVNCGHKLCKKCYRYPDTGETKPAEPRERKRKAPSPTKSETLDNWLASTSSALALHPATREPEINRISATRRVRRVCHLCTAPFVWTERICQDCDHRMCSLCPQDYPFETEDSAGRQTLLRPDRMFKKPRLRVKYTCEKCGALLQEKTDFCSHCGHLRCSDCSRRPPPRNPTPEPSAEALASLQHRLGD